MTYDWIDRQQALEALIDRLVVEDRYAIDTEFHRERTYYPRLALVQLAWSDGLALVDPLAVDPHALTRLFDSPALAVAHAAQQDLDVLSHAVGAVPRRLFDSQVAAGFTGYGCPATRAPSRQNPCNACRAIFRACLGSPEMTAAAILS